MKAFNKTLLVTAITLGSTSAMANNINVSGFGSLGYVQHDEKGSEVNHITSKGSWGATTLLGLQADVKLSDKLSATGQIKLSEDHSTPEKMQVTLEMAFLGYQVAESLKVRIGRLRAPFFLDSEYLDVGYVRTTATRPLAVYEQAHLLNYNGADMIFTHYTESDLELQIQPYIGQEQSDTLDSSTVGMNVALIGDDWKLRAGYSIKELNDLAFNSTDPVQQSLNINNDMGAFYTLGAHYDDGEFLATFELARNTIEDAKEAPNLTGGYVTLGYHLGSLTPYIIYQAQKTDEKNREIGVNSDFKGLSLGAKYEFSKVAVKAEVTHFDFGKNGSYGYQNTLTDNDTTTLKSANVLNLTLETIF